MKSSLLLLFVAVLAFSFPPAARAADSDREQATALSQLAKGHEQVFKTLTGDHIAVVLQKGEKQFTVYGVTQVRAVGVVVEITVKNGEKYSVSAADVFFISNNSFKI